MQHDSTLQPSFNDLTFKHIYRQENILVDKLSKKDIDALEGVLCYGDFLTIPWWIGVPLRHIKKFILIYIL